MIHGATPETWEHFSKTLGLTRDLLPVVSNPNAVISPNSKMKGVGKTPSGYNANRQVIGLSDWTSRHSTPEDVARWAKEPDYGICIQTRDVRAIDVDITDQEEADLVASLILDNLGFTLPRRYRENSSKFLLAFRFEGTYAKRVLRTQHGIIEFLANGQQFIAAGTHTSGVHYLWAPSRPASIPTLTIEQFEAVWSILELIVAVQPATSSKASVKAQKLEAIHEQDPVAQYLANNNWVKATERDGRLHITCPFEENHTADTGDASTTYWPAHTGGYINGHFKCLHAHCEHRSDQDYLDAIGMPSLALADFDNLDETEPLDKTTQETAQAAPVNRFPLVRASDFASVKAPPWIIKGVLPQAELIVLFGESGSGKSFIGLDMAGAIATDTDWQGRRTQHGAVVYIAAEGAGGVRQRLKAYAISTNINLEDLNLYVIPATPNLLEKVDALDLAKAIKGIPDVKLIIVDTWAQATAGGNENSGEDMGKALSHCRGIYRATGATVFLIHHSGKNSAKGARGWSGLRAAADCELEVIRHGNERVLAVTKQKDADDGGEFGFRLEVVPTGADEDGEVISSCHVVYDKSVTLNRIAPRNMRESERRIVDALRSCFDEHAVWPYVEDVINHVITLAGPSENGKPLRRDNLLRTIDKMVVAGHLERKGLVISLPENLI